MLKTLNPLRLVALLLLVVLALAGCSMKSGPEKALARVINSFGEPRPHCAYVFANKRANRMKVLVCDGFGLWLAARPAR